MKKVALLLLVATVSCGRVGGQEHVDLAVVHRIKTEAFNDSQVMDHLFRLTDVNGPRLTGSPGFETAAKWAVQRVQAWGLENVRLEPWGPFGRGWEFTRFNIHLNRPTFALLHGAPMAWCEGTPGPVHGEVVAAPFLREDDNSRTLDLETISARLKEYTDRWHDQLRGKIVLLGRLREFTQATDPPSQRLDDKSLTSLTTEPELAPTPIISWIPDRLPRDTKKIDLLFRNLPMEIRADYSERRSASMTSSTPFFGRKVSWRYSKWTLAGREGSCLLRQPVPVKPGLRWHPRALS